MQTRTSNVHRLATAALCCLLPLAGCSLSLSPLSRRSAAFGNTATAAIRNASTAYQTVETTTYRAQVSSLVLDFDRKGFDRTRIQPFLPAHDLQVRQTLLRGLGAYAQQLAEVAGDKAFTSVDEQSAALATQLQALSADPTWQQLAPGSSATEANLAATAVDTLGRVLLERKRAKALPPILARMQPVLERLCALLEADLGDRPTPGHAGTGLRAQLWLQYDALLSNQQDFVAESGGKLSPGERAAEIAKLPQLLRDQQAADDALAQTKQSLEDLVATHRALLLPDGTGTFQTRLQQLVADSQSIADFYSKLNKT